MRLALYQPDIPHNTGAILRLAACFGVPVDIIAPAGFDMSDKALRRAGMDYIEHAAVMRHESWDAFQSGRALAACSARVILLTSWGTETHFGFAFRSSDTLLLGRESTGAPPRVHEAADARVRIPIGQGLRSLNMAIAAAIALAEALRQTGGFPAE